MPKIKTCRAAAKRFKKTGTGKLVRNKAYKSHILTKNSQKRKRNRRKSSKRRRNKYVRNQPVHRCHADHGDRAGERRRRAEPDCAR